MGARRGGGHKNTAGCRRCVLNSEGRITLAFFLGRKARPVGLHVERSIPACGWIGVCPSIPQALPQGRLSKNPAVLRVPFPFGRPPFFFVASSLPPYNQEILVPSQEISLGFGTVHPVNPRLHGPRGCCAFIDRFCLERPTTHNTPLTCGAVALNPPLLHPLFPTPSTEHAVYNHPLRHVVAV